MRKTLRSRVFEGWEEQDIFNHSNKRIRFHRSHSVDFDRSVSSEDCQPFNTEDADSEVPSPTPLFQAQSSTFINWSRTKEEVELDNFIYETQLNNILKNYLTGIKKGIVMLYVVAVTMISVYHVSGLHTTPGGKIFIEQTYFFMFYLTVWMIVVYFFKNLIAYLIPLSILTCQVVVVNMWVGSEVYAFSEYLMSCVWLVFILVMSFPIQWKANSAAFSASTLYLGLRVYLAYRFLPVPLIAAMVLGSLYFTLAARMMCLQVREVYRLLLENQRLIAEMKLILENFPHGVVIQSRRKETQNKIHFTNQEFQTQVWPLASDMKELKKVKVTYSKSKDKLSDQKTTDLWEFLKAQERKLKGITTIKQSNVRIVKPKNLRLLALRLQDSQESEEIEIIEGKISFQ